MAHNSEWQEVLLQDIAAQSRNALVGGPFGSDLVSSDYSSTGVPVIRGENLSLGRWVGGDFVFVTRQRLKGLLRTQPVPWILYSLSEVPTTIDRSLSFLQTLVIASSFRRAK